MTKQETIDSLADLESIVRQALESARKYGATSAEADIGTGEGLSVTVRMGELETIEYQRDKGLGVTVYIDHRKGSASTTDFSEKAMRDSVQAACAIAKNASAIPGTPVIKNTSCQERISPMTGRITVPTF